MSEISRRCTTRANECHGAFTLAELIAVMAIIGVCIALFLPMFARGCGNRGAAILKDASQIRGIHQSWLAFAGESAGELPTPGLIKRQSVDGQRTPGRGKENKLENTTAHIHAMCIMQNFYSPQFCIGSTEPSEKVVRVKSDYIWQSYNPLEDVYWDSTFKADLQTESNISFASMPVAGERQARHWRNTLGGSFATIGNRGVRNGSVAQPLHNQSITLKIHGDGSTWRGNVCFGDAHCELVRGFYPPNVLYRNRSGGWEPDNLFRNDNYGMPTANGVSGADCWLAITQHLYGSPDEVVNLKNSWD
jgi:prepilin-type N-terminal cleavage/methylation domain-containing protein